MKCPKCGSVSINQFRMPTGAIWCNDCGFISEHKEIYNPFVGGNKDIEELIPTIKYDSVEYPGNRTITEKINEIVGFLNKLDDRIELVEKKIKECEAKVYG